MKKFDLGQAITVLANLGVIGGILLLAYELRQNNELMEAEARFNRLAVATENNESIFENAELAELLLKDRNQEELNELERYRLDLLASKIVLTREWTFREIPRSELPIERWRRATEGMPSMRIVYERNRGTYDPEFEEWFEKNILNAIPDESQLN